MLHQLLVTLDGSKDSERALELAGYLAKTSSARVTLLTVSETVNSPFEAIVTEAAENRRQRALAYLDEHAQALRETGVSEVSTTVRFGQPSLEIANYAKEQHFDLIVMSTQGLGADGRYALGSVALKVLMTAHCPVLMVRINQPDPPKDVAEERWQSEGGSNVG